ncbi:MAG: amino acid decarboxylase [Clostridia bacterium]|nr:amino acid decarboxylase [Clostridia bacterium]
MKTPIYDFIKKYSESDTLRLHMPGHKGKTLLGPEPFDITEFDGADCLYSASGIIKESESNASALFGADTFYSTEGSSLCIRAMLFLARKYALINNKKPLVLAGRNAHKSFLSAVALLDIDVEWLYGKDCSYLSCDIDVNRLRKYLTNSKDLPVALYITSPDYLGNSVNVKGIAEVCREFDILLLVDNAHGAYLKFLPESKHPIDLGATMCCDSAHKTLPALTGASYLHISKNAGEFFKNNVKDAMSLFASTSPSYLILQSLDLVNAYLTRGYKERLYHTIESVSHLKTELVDYGYTLIGSEPLKVVLSVKPFGYNGFEFNELLKKSNIVCEFYDQDYVVFMITTETETNGIERLKKLLLSITKRKSVNDLPPKIVKPKRVMSVRDAVLSVSETVDIKDAKGRVLSSLAVNCPPAVPIIISGEIIDEIVISSLVYYGITKIEVVK